MLIRHDQGDGINPRKCIKKLANLLDGRAEATCVSHSELEMQCCAFCLRKLSSRSSQAWPGARARGGWSADRATRAMFAAHRSRQSVPPGKGTSKLDQSTGGPVVKDPEDGLIRTPKGLFNGATQVPAKQLAGLMSTLNDDATSMTASDAGDAFLNTFPSMGAFSAMGSVTGSASEAGEDLLHRTFPGELDQVNACASPPCAWARVPAALSPLCGGQASLRLHAVPQRLLNKLLRFHTLD